jgi:hypothetical protein
MLSACFKESFALVCQLPMVYTLLHLCYGAGFIGGLLSPRYRREEPDNEPRMIRIKAFGDCW